MALGILESRTLEHVPGTAILHEQNDIPDEYRDVPVEILKKGRGRFSHVILVPQPSDDPNDPLNWPQWKKELILLIIGLSAAVVGAFGPMLSPGFVQVSKELDVSVNTLSQATAWLILCIGLSLFVANPLAKMFGRRPVYMVAIIIMFAASIWCAAAENYSTFLGGRVFSGIGMAPYEVLVQCTIGDLYFVHERATRIAVWNMFLLTGIAGGSLIAGFIIQDLGYQWTFWLCAILFGMCMLGVIFLVPETLYRREDRDTLFATLEQSGEVKNKIDAQHVEDARMNLPIPQKMSYIRSLRVYTGRYTKAPFWRIFIRPFVVFWYPAVLWAFLVYGTTLTWIVVFSVVNGVIFTQPPYNFTVSETGLISLSPFILTILGELVAGPLNDWLCVKLTERNRGIYEPEFRLVLILPVAIVGAVGFFGFGATVHYQTHWSGPVLTFGLANMALAFASVCVFGYVLDAHSNLSEEAFVAINARNILTFGLTYFVNNWLAADGALNVFCTLGGLFLFVCLLTIPLWIFGKRTRSMISRNTFLGKVMADLE